MCQQQPRVVAKLFRDAVANRADLINPGVALGSLTATLTSLDPFTVRVVPGQGSLTFAPVPANGQVTSNNTFTILTDTAIPLDFTTLQWTFQTVAAAPRTRLIDEAM